MTNEQRSSTQALPRTETHKTVRLNPDPAKYPALHLSHCLLSPYYKREAITAENVMTESDELDLSMTQYSTIWQVTVVLKKSFKPEIPGNLLPLSLEMIQSNFPKLSYDNNDQPILIYSREVNVLSLSNDLLAMDHMQRLNLSVLHELRQPSDFFKIKYLTHLVLVLSFGWQLEFDAYITFDVDNNNCRIQFTPTLHELTQFIEYELNHYARSHKEGVTIGVILLRILRLICAPILEMKRILFSNHRRLCWILIPRQLLHMQLFYISNKYEYSITISKNGQMIIQENINASSRPHEPFKKQVALMNTSQSNIMKDNEALIREFIATIKQLNRYSISLEIFDKVCEQFTTSASHVKRDGTNLTFSIRGIKYCIYIKDQDELCLSIDMDQKHSFTDEEAKYLSQVLFSKKVFYSILECGVNSNLPLTAFYSLFVTIPNTNLLKQVLQTSIAYQKESGSMDEEEYDNSFSFNLMEYQEPMSSIMNTPSEEKKKRLLYCDILYYVPFEGLKFPKAISILQKIIGIHVNCIASTLKELFIILRFQERDMTASSSQDTNLKFVDMPILINPETSTVTFDILGDFKKSNIGSIGGAFLNKILLQHTKSQIEQNPLGLVVGQLCLLTLNELYNME